MNSNFEVRPAGDDKGLGLFALKDFEENDIIFEEVPLVSAQYCWNEAYGYLSCHHCLRPMESTLENIKRLTNNEMFFLPHPELCPTDKSQHRYCDLCGIGFCSETCKDASISEYHRTLCKANRPALNKLVEEWKTIHYPPETTSIMLLAKIIAIIEQSRDSEKTISTFFEFAHNYTNKKEDVIKFMGEGHIEKVKKIYALIHEVLPTTFVKNFVTEDGLMKLLALIGRNGQGVGTSIFSEWVKKVENLELAAQDKNDVDSFINDVYEAMDKQVGTFLNNEGSGLYRFQRTLNHSCMPNASVTFPYSNSTLSLAAVKRINAGEEICISYLDECVLERSRHSRRAILRDYYLFECQCDRCIQQANDPDETSEEEESEGMELQ